VELRERPSVELREAPGVAVQFASGFSIERTEARRAAAAWTVELAVGGACSLRLGIDTTRSKRKSNVAALTVYRVGAKAGEMVRAVLDLCRNSAARDCEDVCGV